MLGVPCSLLMSECLRVRAMSCLSRPVVRATYPMSRGSCPVSLFHNPGPLSFVLCPCQMGSPCHMFRAISPKYHASCSISYSVSSAQCPVSRGPARQMQDGSCRRSMTFGSQCTLRTITGRLTVQLSHCLAGTSVSSWCDGRLCHGL